MYHYKKALQGTQLSKVKSTLFLKCVLNTRTYSSPLIYFYRLVQLKEELEREKMASLLETQDQQVKYSRQ